MIKFNNTTVDIAKFPDGTPLIKQPEEFKEQNVITWKFENMEELFVLTCLVKELRNHNPQIYIRLVLPYVPNARQDRIQNEKSDVFTLKWFCEAINDLRLERVTIFDIHSNITPALLNNVHSLNAGLFVNDALIATRDNIDLFFYPDNGAQKKYSECLKFPSSFGVKKRNWDTGKIEGLDIVGNVANKNILIVDDICSYGGTFLHSAKRLKELGANKIWLYVTHCENTILQGELINSGLIERIFTTDSIFSGSHDLIEIIKNF